ncbi:MAG TPA: LuxR family transcriptional regulator, partial [Firmicutes bacterium]|nr:LuxR family transcriptional regulator [Bacillota bacterium]
MKRIIVWNGRLQSILAFSLLSSYILSFLFEGQILYSLLELYELETPSYIIEAIIANFLGLFSCGLFTKSIDRAKTVMLLGMGTSFVATIPFFFAPSPLWFLGLIVGGYASGVALAAWGYFLKAFTPQQERL